jgi:hypothetical protein
MSYEIRYFSENKKSVAEDVQKILSAESIAKEKAQVIRPRGYGEITSIEVWLPRDSRQ